MMDRNLDIDNFERLLKERSDEFKMYPTKRVWYSIYNNIHPSKKWPSIAMSITLIAILLLVGYLNTNNKDTNTTTYGFVEPKQSISGNSPTIFYDPFLKITSSFNQNSSTPFVANIAAINLGKINNINSVEVLNLSTYQSASVDSNKYNYEDRYNITFGSNETVLDKYSLAAIEPIKNEELTSSGAVKNESVIVLLNNKIQNFIIEKNTFGQNDALNLQNKTSTQFEENSDLKNSSLIAMADLNEVKNIAINSQNKILVPGKKDITLKEEIYLSNVEKAWVENYALYNKPAPKKWLGKLAWQTYITPSIVYRNLKNTISTEGDINKMVKQHPSVGLEIGRGLIYSLSKGIQLKTGLQVNFTRYNAEGFENSHPVAATITLNALTNNPYQVYKSTPFSNSDGITPIKLHNETFQISIPMGIDIKIAGNENLQWNFGVTIQPSYVFGGKSYLISSDNRNYIKETNLLNRWNLNAGFETFISYKVNGFTLQLGPQFRKQLFTTNTKQYSMQEKLTNYGFKFGISKLIK